MNDVYKKKSTIKAAGPFLLVLVIVSGFILLPFDPEVSPDTLSKGATSASMDIVVGNRLKNAAMEAGDYVPFFGSSELNRIDSFHPSVLAHKYKRNYKPFLLGTAGTQSLSHFSMLHSMDKEMQGRKVVFIISPQWFTKAGNISQIFSNYFSSIQTYDWLAGLDDISTYEKYYANRLLEFDFMQNNSTISQYISKISKGEGLTEFEKTICALQIHLLNKEDLLFGGIGMTSVDISELSEPLPDEYDIAELDRLAYRTGEESSGNNRFQIKNNFYSNKLELEMKGLKNSQLHYSYVRSPEYADFQLVLSEIARLDIDALFIIPPVNGLWMNYTGLSENMLEKFSTKIKQQLTSQGFNNILDLTDSYDVDYFMEDTIHLGWRGWVAVDEAVKPFLSDGETLKTEYSINDYYLSEEWANSADIK